MADQERGLFQIRAVNKDTDEVVFSEEVVGEGESDAMFNSKLKDALKEKNLAKDDVYILCKELGSLPKKERSKTVKLISQIGNLVLGKETTK